MFDKQKIEYIAKLAYIELSEQEKKVFSEQLSSILDYVNQLNEINTDNIEITSNSIDKNDNVLRDDIVQKCPKNRIYDLIDLAPNAKDNLINTKNVF